MDPSGNSGRVFGEVNITRRHSRRVIAVVEPACRRLVSQALNRGGHDNVTVIVARFESPA